jgi:hypothetical protein
MNPVPFGPSAVVPGLIVIRRGAGPPFGAPEAKGLPLESDQPFHAV